MKLIHVWIFLYFFSRNYKVGLRILFSIKTFAHLRVLDRELENDVLVCQRLVDLGECIQLGLNVNQVLRVKEDLQHLGTVHLISDALADNLGGVDNIL